MTVETATYLDDLVATNPADSDPVSEGAAHLRLLKEVLQATFPGVTGAVTATHTEINATEGRLDTLESNRARKDIAETFASNVSVTGNVAVTGNLTVTGTNNLIPAGIIAMWSGSIASIPAGWTLCDGTAGTPDLRNLFIMGAGSVAPGTTGGTNSQSFASDAAGGHNHTTSSDGAHTHGGTTGGTALTASQMPAHQHAGTVDAVGDHQHLLYTAVRNSGSGGTIGGVGVYSDGTMSTEAAGAHSHTFTTDSRGSGAAHDHTISSGGDHTHTVSTVADHTHTVSFDNRPAFYALALLMKL